MDGIQDLLEEKHWTYGEAELLDALRRLSVAERHIQPFLGAPRATQWRNGVMALMQYPLPLVHEVAVCLRALGEKRLQEGASVALDGAMT